jgi:hypothetical protein
MRLLLDESVPRKIRVALVGHEVRAVVEMDWAGRINGEFLPFAATAFDAFLTADCEPAGAPTAGRRAVKDRYEQR